MRRVLVVLAAAAVMAAGLQLVPGDRGPVEQAAVASKPREAAGATGRVLVRFRPDVAAERRAEVARGVGATRTEEHPRLGIRALTVPEPRAAAGELRGRREVLWAEPEVLLERFQDASTPERAELSFDEAARDTRRRGRGITVAVIDDGVYADNPDLRGRVDDGGDHSTGRPVATGGTVPVGAHGTAVATILAAADDEQGIVGAVPEARVLAIKVFTPGGGASTLAVASAIVAAADRGAAVANLSLGAPFDSQALRDAIAEARRVAPGMVLVAAAGNDGAEVPNYPAADPYVVSVGATERRPDGVWTVAGFSTRGDVDLLAPGRGVLAWYAETGPPRSVVPVNGTSFAAPAVAGIVAQLAGVGVTGDRARAAVVASAERPNLAGQPSVASGRGRADAARAFAVAAGTAAYTAVFVHGGNQVANGVGRRTVEAVRVGPAPAAVTARHGVVTGAVTTSAGSVHRTVATYVAPAADLGPVDTTLNAAEGVAQVRLITATTGPEGRLAEPGVRESPVLTFGSRTRYVVSAVLRQGSVLTIDFAYPGSSEAALLYVWEGSAADPPVAADRSGAYSGTLRFTAPRTGRYAFGFVLDRAADDGTYALTARFPAPGASALTPLPVASTSLSATTAFPVRWSGPTGTFDVEYAVGAAGAWRPWLSSTRAPAATFGGSAGQTYRFRVRARDDLGNGGPWTAPRTVAVPLDERHALVRYSAGWTPTAPAGRYARTLRTATAAGAAAQVTVTTSRFVVVGERCASCGQVRVYVDGVLRATVDTRAATAAARVVLWDSGALPARAHTLRLVVVGTARRPYVGLDGVAFLR